MNSKLLICLLFCLVVNYITCEIRISSPKDLQNKFSKSNIFISLKIFHIDGVISVKYHMGKLSLVEYSGHRNLKIIHFAMI